MIGIRDVEFDFKERNQKFKIAIEGNIASGKSTLLNHFATKEDAEAAFEPVDKWQDVGGKNLLGLMYEDKERWSFMFQSYVLLTMMEVHCKDQTKPLYILERTAYGGRYCFVENLRKSGSLDLAEYTCYTEWFDWIMKTRRPQLDLIVYLRTSPEVCHRRLRERARNEEVSVSLDYLESLHDCYENWLGNPDNHGWHGNCPVLILNGDRDVHSHVNLFETMRDEILETLAYENPLCQTPPTTNSVAFPLAGKARRNLEL